MSRAEQRYSFVPRALLLILLASSFSAPALTRYVFDFDGTVVQDQGPTAAWRTPWKLVRTDARHTSLQANPSVPIEITIPTADGNGKKIFVQHPDILHVSYGEYKEMRRFLAGGERELGSIDPKKPVHLPQALLEVHRPEWIIPGFYRVVPEITFDHYQTIGRASSLSPLVADYINAKQRTLLTVKSETPLDWRGPAFTMLVNVLANKQNRDRISFATARAMTKADFDQLFDLWLADGHIQNVPKALGYTLLSLGDPALMSLVGKGSLVEKKKEAAFLEAKQNLMRPKALMHFELSSDPRRAKAGELEKRHTLVFPEDDPLNVQAIGDLFASLSMHPHFKYDEKFVLFQTGKAQELNPRWPYRYVVFHDGLGRPATEKEIFIWENALEPQSPCEYELL